MRYAACLWLLLLVGCSTGVETDQTMATDGPGGTSAGGSGAAAGAGAGGSGGDGAGHDASAAGRGGRDASSGRCACNADVNGDGVAAFFDSDNGLITHCIGQDASALCEGCRGGTCAVADVDCNGTIDQCDVYRLACVEAGREACCSVPCGACEVSDTADPISCTGAGLELPCCRLFDKETCSGVGRFLGDGVPCPG